LCATYLLAAFKTVALRGVRDRRGANGVRDPENDGTDAGTRCRSRDGE
jgi:hypothetical protein